MDSNHRRHSRQIYSLLPLATRATLRYRSLLPPLETPLPGFGESPEPSTGNRHYIARVRKPTFPACFYYRTGAELKLARGLEPRTPGLQNRCSTVELRQPEPKRPVLLRREE